MTFKAKATILLMTHSDLLLDLLRSASGGLTAMKPPLLGFAQACEDDDLTDQAKAFRELAGLIR